MNSRFVAKSGDEMASIGATYLGGQIIDGDQVAYPPLIALYTETNPKAHFVNKFLRVVPYKMGRADGFNIPTWIKTPFVVAIASPIRTARAESFHEALSTMARQYETWEPRLSIGSSTPWAADAPEASGYREWREKVKACYHDHIHPLTAAAVLTAHGVDAVVGDPPAEAPDGKKTLLIMGCASYNKPHTDVVDILDSGKADTAAGALGDLVTDIAPWLRKVICLVVDRDFLFHPGLRASIHPFFFMAIDEIERVLGEKFHTELRLWGREGRRSMEQVAEAMDAGARAVQRQIVARIEERSSLPVHTSSWAELLGGYLDDAWRMALEHRGVAERIYDWRVAMHEWYRKLQHALGREAGLGRTLGNNAVYIALALYLRDNPETLVIDCEIDDQFWRGLQPVLDPIWGENKPYIGSVPPPVRQPWGY